MHKACNFLFAISSKDVNGNTISEMVNFAKRTAVTPEYKTTPNNNDDRTINLPDILRSFKSKPAMKTMLLI